MKIGDEVEILERGTETVVTSLNPIYIKGIDNSTNTLSLQNKPTLNSNTKYDLRRKLNKSQYEGLPDVLNLYVDLDEYAYVASNSLPSSIRSNFKFDDNSVIDDYRLDIQESVKSVNVNSTANLKDLLNDVYNTFEVNSVPFITGDQVYYSSQGEPLVGLTTGTYFVKKLSNTKFQLHGSQSTIAAGSNLTFQIPPAGVGIHTFILNSQKNSEIQPQKLLRKIPLEKNINLGSGQLTTAGKTGVLINGVETVSYTHLTLPTKA